MGQATAKVAADQGATLILLGRNNESLLRVAKMLRVAGDTRLVVGDATDDEARGSVTFSV